MTLQSIASNIAAVRREIAAAALACGRDPGDIELIAVSKTQPAAAIRAAAPAACRAFGENYPAEAAAKQDELEDLNVTWHFIGAIQSNKTRLIASRFAWVHTVARAKIARRLSEQVPPGQSLNVCLQVNVDRDPLKTLLGRGETLVGRLVVFDALRTEFRHLRVKRDPACPVCRDGAAVQLADYERFCGTA